MQTQTPAIRLRREQFMRHAAANGLANENQIAVALGVDRSCINRLLNGATAPGGVVIASVLLRFPDKKFEDFFEVTAAMRRQVRYAA